MFQWMHFRNEPKKATVRDQTYEIINTIFRKFFNTGSWFVYFIAMSFLVIGIIYFFIDQRRKRSLLERRRQILRNHERPPQRRRPGAASRNHEIYRSVMEKVNDYIEPSSRQECVFRQTRSGTIYGQLGNPSFDRVDEKDSEKDIASVEMLTSPPNQL